jgi:NitT/TauT family transport system permease protein
MQTQLPNTYSKSEAKKWPIPNHWDVFALLIVLAILILLGWGAKHMSGQFNLDNKIPISLSPWALPGYALQSFLRMMVAMLFSLLFTFVFGTWAAKSKAAAKIIVPLIDILQSVPVLGFLSITVIAFIALFKGSMLGPEAAAVFAIFTAQVWNMTLSMYQSLITVPNSMHEAASMFKLSAWQRFWRVEAPFATPGLIWNMMMSMSGSWVFLVLSEAITVTHKNITLPGIGSYIALAIEKANNQAILYVIVAMFCVILIYDQLLFRPLIAWSEKFKMNTAVNSEEPTSWFLDLFQRARVIKSMGTWFHRNLDFLRNGILFRRRKQRNKRYQSKNNHWLITTAWYLSITAIILYALEILASYIFQSISLSELSHVINLGAWTALRVAAVIIISSLVWIPIGVLIGRHHRATQWVQPIAQFLAAFPASLLFPIATLWIITYHLNVSIWCAPLMILGTQWYILFNVIAGTQALPQNLHDAAGGAWNLSIVAEALSWGKYHLNAHGLGAYLTAQYTAGNFPQLTLGIAVMSCYVVLINRVLWCPLYQLAEKRYQLH